MKRTREDIEKALVTLRDKKAKVAKEIARVEKKIGVLNDELEDLDYEEAMARSLRVPWTAFSRAVRHTREAWVAVEIQDPYDERDECMGGDCWYRNNLDRLDGLQLYELATLQGPDLKLCDMCVSNGRDEIVDSERLERRYGGFVRLDPNDYEDEIAAYLTKVANGSIAKDEMWEEELPKFSM